MYEIRRGGFRLAVFYGITIRIVFYTFGSVAFIKYLIG